jgi:outer membrane cobalamin receptor
LHNERLDRDATVSLDLQIAQIAVVRGSHSQLGGADAIGG